METCRDCECVEFNVTVITRRSLSVFVSEYWQFSRPRLKCDGTRAETRFRLSAKRTSPFKSARWASVQSTTGSRGERISGSNAGYTMFWGSVKSTGYPLHSPVSPSLPFPCVTVWHHISTGVCHKIRKCYYTLPYTSTIHCYHYEMFRSFRINLVDSYVKQACRKRRWNHRIDKR